MSKSFENGRFLLSTFVHLIVKKNWFHYLIFQEACTMFISTMPLVLWLQHAGTMATRCLYGGYMALVVWLQDACSEPSANVNATRMAVNAPSFNGYFSPRAVLHDHKSTKDNHHHPPF